MNDPPCAAKKKRLPAATGNHVLRGKSHKGSIPKPPPIRNCFYKGVRMIHEILSRVDCFAVLRACEIETHGRDRLACPIHGGDSPNFKVYDSGASWCCHSHGCGGRFKRDAVNLYCLIRFGAALPELARQGRAGEALAALCGIAGIPYRPGARPLDAQTRHIRPDPWRGVPDAEIYALGDIFHDTSRLAELGAGLQHPTARKALLFLEIARSENALPGVIPADWGGLKQMEAFLYGRN